MSSGRRRVVVTGLGLISPVGNSVATLMVATSERRTWTRSIWPGRTLSIGA